MKIIDLSHLLNNQTPVYPGTEKPVFTQANIIDKDGFAETKICMYSHTGTHMDAPGHMISGAKSLDEFEVSQFYGSAICIDCNKVLNATISLNDLLPFGDLIKQIDFILLKTLWSEKWLDNEYFGAFPTLSVQACEWLTGFNLKGIGLDTISIDKMGSQTMENHLIILRKGMVIIENLNNLQDIGNEIFTFSCFPVRYENADGSPVRAVAILND
jgi:kynurenine formamidase